VPVIVPTEEANNFKLTPAQLSAAITPRTTMLLVCSPSNPTGTMYSPQELGELADVVVERNLTVVSDEIYERLVYGDHKFASFATVRPGMQERTILVNGASKAYAMTGWRIGWTLSPAKVATAMADLQSQETSNPSSVSQYAAIAALEGPQDCVAKMLAEFSKRRDYVRQRIAKIPGLTCPEMAGAFYAFINIKPYLGRSYGGTRVDNSTQWCLTLLERHNVATVMGSAFGAEGYARISFATGLETLAAGFDGIEAFLKSAN
jgi:aspartate aminotransferase